MNKDNVVKAIRKEAALRKQAQNILGWIPPAARLYTFLQIAMLAGTGGALGYGAAKLTVPKDSDNENAQKEYEAASLKSNVDKLYARLATEKNNDMAKLDNPAKPARVLA